MLCSLLVFLSEETLYDINWPYFPYQAIVLESEYKNGMSISLTKTKFTVSCFLTGLGNSIFSMVRLAFSQERKQPNEWNYSER